MKASPRFLSQRWFQILAAGVVLFFGLQQALKITNNVGLFPAVVLIGALVVPVSFVAYFYSQERIIDQNIHAHSALRPLLLSFTVGGLIGAIVATILEFGTLNQTNITGLFGVGAIEESAKLILPLILYMRASYRSEADGLLFGIASGMGFAFLETMGYGIVAFIQSSGSLGILEQVLLIRGLLSPANHAAWTGLITATLWRRREQTGKSFNPTVIWAFVIAIVLHAVWDITSFSSSTLINYLGYVVIGGISIILLFRRLTEARQSKPHPAQSQA